MACWNLTVFPAYPAFLASFGRSDRDRRSRQKDLFSVNDVTRLDDEISCGPFRTGRRRIGSCASPQRALQRGAVASGAAPCRSVSQPRVNVCRQSRRCQSRLKSRALIPPRVLSILKASSGLARRGSGASQNSNHNSIQGD